MTTHDHRMVSARAVLLVFCVLSCCQILDAWRRRRGDTPPSAINCVVSEWSPWSQCSTNCSIGVTSRTRTKTTVESNGGTCTYALNETKSCGSDNGGCTGPGASCDEPTGVCSCNQTGYLLDQDQKTCKWTGCPSNPCRICPNNTYSDQFMPVCQQCSSSCTGNYTNSTCSGMTCPSNYKLATIVTKPDSQFAELISSADFVNVVTNVTCKRNETTGFSSWSPDVTRQFCRRLNDPPTNLTLSGNTLLEHAAVGTVIGTFSALDPQVGQEIVFNVTSSLFSINGTKLQSTWQDPNLNGPISLNNGEVAITIRATDNGNPPMWREQEFKVRILDVNDPPGNISLSNHTVNKNAQVGSLVGVFTAIDGDDPTATPSSNFTWELTNSSNGLFKLNGSNLVVAKPLNNVPQNQIQIEVKCTDSGQPFENATQKFVIYLIMYDDYHASITYRPISVKEDASVGTTAGTLTATQSLALPVTLSINHLNNTVLEKFKIGATTCSITADTATCTADILVKSELDFEDKSTFTFTASANFSKGVVTREFTITVKNVNEAPTDIYLNGTLTVPENAVAGAIVGSFLVTDPDKTQTHNCSLVNSAQSTGSSYFTVENGTVLEVKGEPVINYEKTRHLAIKVTCTDDGDPNLSTTKDFNITVTNQNEPPLQVSITSQTVPENSPLGTLVGSLSCEEPDKLTNDKCTFTIDSQNYAFRLGSDGKSVLVNGSLDYEVEPVIDIVVVATDKGGLYKKVKLQINITDQNDAPTGINLPGNGGDLSVYENSRSGTVISAIKLVDQDGDPPSCSLTDDAGGRVAVQGTNLITGSANSDFEESAVLHITLSCSDGKVQSIQKSFNITVKDVNEVPTDITLSHRQVLENEANTRIGIITVTDPDVNQSHRCTVCDVIDEGRCDASADFIVDERLQLLTSRGLDFESGHIRRIVINCTDNATSPQMPLSVEKAFNITVIDVNEPPTSVCSSPFEQAIRASVGSVVARLSAVDPDNAGSVKQALTYKIITGSGVFPFQLFKNMIFKTADVIQPTNFTFSIQVTDDGRVVTDVSPNGLTFNVSKPNTVVFNCSLAVTADFMSDALDLRPSVVSVQSRDNSLIGRLSLPKKFPNETFKYLLNSDETVPFAINGDQVFVKSIAMKDYALIFENKSAFVYLDINAESSQGVNRSEGHFVKISDDVPEMKMCLVKKSIEEKKPQGSIVGQLLMEYGAPPLYQCSMTSCCNQIGKVKPDTFPYHCKVDESAIGAGPQHNVSTLFEFDSSFSLRTRTQLSYQEFNLTAGVIQIPYSCYDDQRPLQLLRRTFNVTVLECNATGHCPLAPDCARCDHGGTCVDKENGFSCRCPAEYTGERCEVDIDDCASEPCQNGGTCQDGVASFTCACAEGISGSLCERNSSLCEKCVRGTRCVTFHKAATRCATADFQERIIVNGSDLTSSQRASIEREIVAIIKAVLSKRAGNSRSRRSASDVYAEILETITIGPTNQTLLHVVVLDTQYERMNSTYACALLANSRLPCVGEKDCEVLSLINEPCPGQTEGDKEKQKSLLTRDQTVGVAVAAGLFIIILIIAIAILICKKKKERRRQHIFDRHERL
ncbi:protocadherin Fat 4 isoform X2 [Nematostella vectensis]|uniref:protocadherin Fat 4 isoform X2 n=1 Tax=Nematostella vectensis TaxID=45351 RepID=UPI002076FFAD|nr:protocadherin Fat 4 isoform X2 [Nematostella vectensis]